LVSRKCNCLCRIQDLLFFDQNLNWLAGSWINDCLNFAARCNYRSSWRLIGTCFYINYALSQLRQIVMQLDELLCNLHVREEQRLVVTTSSGRVFFALG
jgi:hypothetical protein